MGGEISAAERDVFDSLGRVAQTRTRVNTGLSGRDEDLTKMGYEVVSGDTDGTRAVYSNGERVVKFEPMGTWRNENEATNWRSALPEDAKHLFAPVLAVAERFEWIVMEYADVDAVTPADHRDLLRELIVEQNLDMTDPHPDNVGMLDGRAVMIDYNFQPKEVADTREEREAVYEKKLRDYDIRP